MKNMFYCFHTLWKKSKKKMQKINLAISSFIALNQELQKMWSNIPTGNSSINNYLEPFKKELRSKALEGDVVLIQGDFGATYIMVDFCKSQNLIPIYATTKRIVSEEKQGNKIIKNLFLSI